MKKFFLTNLLLALLCYNVYSSDKGSIYTYFVTTPNGQDETLFLNYDRNVEVDGKNYQQYVGSYLDRSYADPVLLRREEKKYFYYDSRTSEEHLLFDFDLQKGDAFTDDFSGIVYDVVDVRDSLVNNNLCCLIEIRDCEGTGKHDIWLEDVGSIYTGILPKNKFKDVYLLICFHFDYSIEEDVEHSTYFFPNTPQIKTARMSVTRPQWEKELKTEEDRDEYLTWLHAPTDLNAEFENDTLHIWGTLRTSCSIQTYAACELSGDNITFKVYPYNNLLDEDCISRYEVETRIPGFKRGTYKVNLYNKTLELECAGAEAPHQPLPLLEGNPIWEYKYEHIPTPRSDDWMKCWVDTGDRSFTYYFLSGQREIDGKTYTMMGEIVSRGEDITFNRWYPVREENGIVYTITDSLPGVVEHVYNDDYEIPYLQEGNECILYNFGAEIGDKLDKNNVVKSFDTYQLMDGTDCRVLKTGTHYDLYEKIGYRDDYGTSGLMDPLDGIIIATNGHAYVNRLNAYFQDNKMLYKTPDAREGLCIDDTIWSREDAYEYAGSYKVDPRREEVFAYIQQLQKVTAWEVNIDGLSYLLDPDKHEAIISNGNKCSGELDMPSEVVYEGQTFVTKSMLWNAFYNCTGLTKVRIPKTIETVIHYYPGSILEEPTSVTMLKASDYMNIFRGCLSLEAIEVDVDNPIMCSDNGVLFSKDKTCLYCYPAGISRESFTIPETVTRIGAYAISNNKCLVSLTIPGSVTQICGYTIMYCLALTDVYYPSEEVPVTSRFAFAGSNIPHATLHVPAGSVDAYKSTAPWDFFGNIVALQNPVAFTAGQMATIVLPTEPDASKGKYYRLDRVEGNEIIFEQELQPRAHVPYIIVPSEDFSIDPSDLDLEGLSNDTVSIDGISFIGTYGREELPDYTGGSFYIDIIDTTPDCGFMAETGKGAVVGALRAWLQVNWDDPIDHGGAKSPEEKKQIVLKDNPDGISQLVNCKLSNGKCYDLSGRRIDSSLFTLRSSLKKGIYIEDGKKKVTK